MAAPNNSAGSAHNFAIVRAWVAVVLLCLEPRLLQGSDAEPRPILNSRRVTESLRIPRIDRAPQLEEFLDMQAPPKWAGKLAEVKSFIQRSPDNGRPATELTNVI